MDRAPITTTDWRAELPVLAARMVTLREPIVSDAGGLVALLATSDATRFGLDEVGDVAVRAGIERFAGDRRRGVSFTYAITVSLSRLVVGLLQVRQLELDFSVAEWECMLAPSARGTGLFLEAARLAGSFAFGHVGAHRLEARVPLHNGRANGALRKLGAVQEGVLRGSLRSGGELADHVLWSILKEDWGDHWLPVGPRVH